MHPSSQFHKELAQIVRADDDNRRCCDCGKRNPRWASTNLGCFMCLECSGIHRAIGVHITKIKSITLDKWTRSEVDHMKKVGNRIHNARWEAFLDNGRGIQPQSSMRERDVFIRAKYNGRKYFPISQGTSCHHRSKSTEIAMWERRANRSSRPLRSVPR